MFKPTQNAENNGKPWNDDEMKKVLKLIKNGKTINEIALELKRTYGSIKSRLNNIAVKLHDEGNTINEIQEKLKFLSLEDVNYAIASKKNEKKIPKLTEDFTLELRMIREMLQVLVQIEIKKNNFDYDKLLKEINNKSTEIQSESIQNESDIIQITENNDYEFSETLLKKMKKYSNDKVKLKELRKANGINFSVFYEKLKTL